MPELVCVSYKVTHCTLNNALELYILLFLNDLCLTVLYQNIDLHKQPL